MKYQKKQSNKLPTKLMTIKEMEQQATEMLNQPVSKS